MHERQGRFIQNCGNAPTAPAWPLSAPYQMKNIITVTAGGTNANNCPHGHLLPVAVAAAMIHISPLPRAMMVRMHLVVTPSPSECDARRT